MKNYLWSPSKNAFIPAGMVEDYRSAGWDINELIPVNDDVFAEYSALPPAGKVRGVSADGSPEWIDAPQPTSEEQIAIAERQKLTLRMDADSEIAWRQDAVDAGIATEEETAALVEWRKYRVLLMRVYTSTAPDIEWPTIPEDQAS
ncbi:tail fiber assembly protein [Enterobacter roggenkampii]|uniref:tail fiber assembly protein n=1 Tax=Enterobacter roggenkampii TaxID=1812935 RepID=UPI00242C5C64|nr:tail fiber assembly protein [Enterobacter roggenkampii]WFX57884.1 tail fiber assembly protein [Enterobacter roggenkampii]